MVVYNLKGIGTGNKGGILLAIIVAILAVSILAAVSVSLLSSSSNTSVESYFGERAYYNAESGFRFLAGKYVHGGDDSQKKAIIESIDGTTFNMQDDDGFFTLNVFPYFFETMEGSSSSIIKAKVYGSFPHEWIKEDFIDGGLIKLGNGDEIIAYSKASVNGDIISFIVSGLTNVPGSGVDIFLVNKVNGSQTLKKNNDLLLSKTASDYKYFPEHNGAFTISGDSEDKLYIYRSRQENRLKNIELANQSLTFSDKNIDSDDHIIMDKFIRVRSTGKFGNSIREILYNVPFGQVGLGGFKTVTHEESFGGDSPFKNWFSGKGQTLGDFEVVNIKDKDGKDNKALHVTAVIDPEDIEEDDVDIIDWIGLEGVISKILNALENWFSTDEQRWSVIFLDYRNIAGNLVQSWHESRGSLSYDAQVKISHDITLDKKYMLAGMLFRTRLYRSGGKSDVHTYGLSIIRGRYYQDKTFFSWDGWMDSSILLCGRNFEDSGIEMSILPRNLYPKDDILLKDDLPGFEFEFTKYYHRGTDIERSCAGVHRYIFSKPAILLWERTGSGFNWLAYKYIDGDSHLNEDVNPGFSLKKWSTLSLNLAEGEALDFTSGIRKITKGDILRGRNSNASARVLQVIIESGDWNGSARGKIILSGKMGNFSGGEKLVVRGADVASAGGFDGQKRNYIRVFYGDTDDHGIASSDYKDNERKKNSRDSIEWYPNDPENTGSGNDFFTIVEWDGVNTGLGGLRKESDHVVSSSSLTSPDWVENSPSFDPPEFVGLSTGGYTGDKIYFDDFGIRLDLKSGSGFLPPIQE